MNSVEDLDVFKLAHQLALRTYSVTKEFPREELFSLGNQVRRAAGSICMNLMEGAMRLGSREYRQFVGIARGSAGEVCYQLLLARDLNYFERNLSGAADGIRPSNPDAITFISVFGKESASATSCTIVAPLTFYVFFSPHGHVPSPSRTRSRPR